MQDNSQIRTDHTDFCEQAAQEIEAEWRELSQQASEPSPFLDYDLACAALPLYAKPPQLLTIYKGQLLIGVLLLQGAKGYAKLPLRYLSTAYHSHQFFAAPLWRHGYELEAAKGLCDWLDHNPLGIQFLYLTHLAGNGSTTKALQLYSKADKRRCDIVHHYQRPAVICDKSYEDYLTTNISSKRRKKTRQKFRRLEEVGPTNNGLASTPEQASQWLEEFFRLEKASWKGAAGSALASNPEQAAFYRTVIPNLASKGQLRFSRMTAGTVTLAMTIDIVYQGEGFTLKTAYNPEYAAFSPGALIEFVNLARFLDKEEVDCVDSCMAEGNEALDGIWAERKEIVQLVLGKKTPLDALALTMARLLERARAVVK
ncbi:MAG: GNAT family N-acetyltransferase [bacterium]